MTIEDAAATYPHLAVRGGAAAIVPAAVPGLAVWRLQGQRQAVGGIGRRVNGYAWKVP